MKFSLSKEDLLQPLSLLNTISTVKNPTFPILSNVYISITNDKITFIATDLEIELSISIINKEASDIGQFTIPCKKLFDIIRYLDDNISINFDIVDNKATIKVSKSKFVLTVLPAEEFPKLDHTSESYSFTISHSELKNVLQTTEFCMASKDVRFYLNGLLIEISNNLVKSVTTDGHRLAYDETNNFKYINHIDASVSDSKLQFLIPRKSVSELIKILEDKDELLEVAVSSNHVTFKFDNMYLSTKLIDSKFPEYNRVIPKETCYSIDLNREELKQALIRSSTLSSDKFNAIRFDFTTNQLTASIHNPEHEEAIEELTINYNGEDFTIGFNISYILDCLNHLNENVITFNFTESHNSCTIHGQSSDLPLYVVMPMRL